MSKSSTAARRLPNREAALESLYSDISAKSMFPFWASSTDVAHDEIKQLMGTQKAVPHRWSYKNDIEPILFRAAELVTMDDSERRSLILVNPGLSPRRATVSTMYTAYRLNDANEVMPPHRHSPNAIRFGLTGKGAWRSQAPLPPAPARRRIFLADVRLSLGSDAGADRALHRLGRRSLRGTVDRIYRPADRRPGVQDHDILRASAAPWGENSPG